MQDNDGDRTAICYVTASQIEDMPRFNNGKSTRTEPYKLWKITGVEKSDQSQ
jgi:hypothetical protein